MTMAIYLKKNRSNCVVMRNDFATTGGSTGFLAIGFNNKPPILLTAYRSAGNLAPAAVDQPIIAGSLTPAAVDQPIALQVVWHQSLLTSLSLCR